MKILFVCHRFPYPPSRGGKIRPFNILSHLGGYAQVTVASLVRSEEERKAGEGLAAHCHKFIAQPIGSLAANLRMLLRLPTTAPSSFGYFWSPGLANAITRELDTGQYDLAFVHCSSVAPYVQHRTDVTKVLDFGDMDSGKWAMYAGERAFPLSTGYWLESVKLRRVEAALAGRFDLCTCTTRAELETLRGLGTARDTDWFPNGVDTEFFRPSDEPCDPDLICFAGRMDYFPNQQAVEKLCNDILPLVRAQRPSARLVVVGAEPPPSIRRLAALPGVTVTGTVSDVRPHVQKAAVSAAPLDVARGTQNKILESMAMGVPVVCTPLAARGVDAVPGEHLLTAVDPPAFAREILGLLEQPQRRAELARRARERVLSHHSWASSLRRLDGMIGRCLSRKGVAGSRAAG